MGKYDIPGEDPAYFENKKDPFSYGRKKSEEYEKTQEYIEAVKAKGIEEREIIRPAVTEENSKKHRIKIKSKKGLSFNFGRKPLLTKRDKKIRQAKERKLNK